MWIGATEGRHGSHFIAESDKKMRYVLEKTLEFSCILCYNLLMIAMVEVCLFLKPSFKKKLPVFIYIKEETVSNECTG